MPTLAPTSTNTPPAGVLRAQKIQLLEIVVGIEQGAALGGAGLMVEPKRRALILHIDRTGAQQIDQPRQHRAERAAFQPRALRERDDGHACADVGANAPKGGGVGSLAAARPGGSVDIRQEILAESLADAAACA